jgi:DNA-binding MarR family transcriptional regulator
MHPTLFSLKRGHLTSLRYSRKILRPHEPLTPARYDLMIAVARAPGARVLQRNLISDLGLHPSTVSKMLTRMEELGLVQRSIDERDGRRRVVTLASQGVLLLQAATAFSVGDIEVVVDSAVAPCRLDSVEVHRLNRVLRRYAWNLRDTAVALYEGPPPAVLAA